MTGTPRPKLIVLKCRCGCDQWAGFQSRPRFDENGIPMDVGMYADSHRAAVANAIRWSRKACCASPPTTSACIDCPTHESDGRESDQ